MGLSSEKRPLLGSSAQDVSQTLLKQSDGPTIPGASHEESKDELVFGENSSIDPKLVTASVFSSLFNLTNTIIGAGALALPFAFRNTGVILGTVVLFGIYLLIVFSVNILISCTKFSGAETYHGIAQAALGQKGVVLTHVAIFITTFGTMTSYLVIIGDMISPAVGLLLGGDNNDYCGFWAQRQVPITAALGVVMPLSVLRNIDSLRYTSLLAVAAVLYLTCVVVVKSGQEFATGSLEELKSVHFLSLSDDIFRSVPIMTLAFTCHMNIFPIITGLKLPTRRRVEHVTMGSLSICFFIYSILGVFGYLTFFTKDKVSGNILLNYDVDQPEIVVGRFAVTLVVMFSYPILAHPCINSVDALLFPKRDFSYQRRAGLVFVVVGITYIIAFFVTEVDLVLGIAGSLGSTAISFVLPALFYIRLHPSPLRSSRKIMAVVLLILGIIFVIVSTVVTLSAAFNASGDDATADECNRTLYDLERGD